VAPRRSCTFARCARRLPLTVKVEGSQTCNRSRLSSSSSSGSRTTQSARRRMTSLCVVRVPFALCILCLTNVFPRCCNNLVIITALAGEYVTVLQRLIDILRKVPPNPSNPNFDQYIFESISGLIQFIGASVPDSIAVFEPALFPSFAEILQKDIDRKLSCQFPTTAECRL
jgi:hypothetical protein